jgi:hypothetical protein
MENRALNSSSVNWAAGVSVDVDVFVVPAEDEFEVLVLAFSVLVALELVYSVLFVVFSSLIFKL